MIEDDKGLGLVQVYTGDGKGKTTSALGLGLRASGHGYRVIMIQFMKGRINYGELESVKKLEKFEIHQFGRPDFVDKDNPAEIDVRLALDGLTFAKMVIKNADCEVLILDEANVAVDYNLFPIESLLELVDSKPESMELIITGRNAHRDLVIRADLVSEILDIKHPFENGRMARKGVEY